jgi:hypothetical protein
MGGGRDRSRVEVYLASAEACSKMVLVLEEHEGPRSMRPLRRQAGSRERAAGVAYASSVRQVFRVHNRTAVCQYLTGS